MSPSAWFEACTRRVDVAHHRRGRSARSRRSCASSTPSLPSTPRSLRARPPVRWRPRQRLRRRRRPPGGGRDLAGGVGQLGDGLADRPDDGPPDGQRDDGAGHQQRREERDERDQRCAGRTLDRSRESPRRSAASCSLAAAIAAPQPVRLVGACAETCRPSPASGCRRPQIIGAYAARASLENGATDEASAVQRCAARAASSPGRSAAARQRLGGGRAVLAPPDPAPRPLRASRLPGTPWPSARRRPRPPGPLRGREQARRWSSAAALRPQSLRPAMTPSDTSVAAANTPILSQILPVMPM